MSENNNQAAEPLYCLHENFEGSSEEFINSAFQPMDFFADLLLSFASEIENDEIYQTLKSLIALTKHELNWYFGGVKVSK